MTDSLDIPAFLKRKLTKRPPSTSDTIVRQERVIVTPASWSKGYVAPEPDVIENDKPKAYQPSIQERIREKHSSMIGEIEGMIDDEEITPEFSMYKYLISLKATPMAAIAIGNKYRKVADEMLDVLGGEDDDLNEAYSRYSYSQLQDLAVIYQSIVDDCDKYAKVNKTVKKARKKKPVSKVKLLKGFQYQVRDDKFKIASIDPATIIGAQELWTFNVKNNLLSVFRAIDRGGLSVKGSSILNFDEKTSTSKTIGRRTDVRLKSVLEGGKVILRKLMEDIAGRGIEPKRLNKTTILLRVIP